MHASGMVFTVKVTQKKKMPPKEKKLPGLILSTLGKVIIRRIGFCMCYYDRLRHVVR